MNTTIIILGALILIVVIAIIVVLVGGKKSKEENVNEDSAMTFKDDPTVMNTSEQQEDLVAPQLHQQVPTQQPIQDPPVLNDLNTPMQSVPTQTVTSNMGQLDSQINQPNPLPDQA
jgi:hypothetical protein